MMAPIRIPAAARCVAAIALTAVLVGPAAVADAAKRTCNPAHSTTIAATATVRVFHTRAFARETRVHATYACLLSRKRPVRLVVPDFPTGYGPIAIAGRFVAYGVYSDCAASFCDPNNVVVQDLRDGKAAFADGPLRVAEVTSLVLRPKGSVAWIQSTFDEGGSTQPGFTVAKAERGRPAVVLDSGIDVASTSLALAGNTLYWMNGPTPTSAILS